MANPTVTLESTLPGSHSNGDQIGVVENLLTILQGLVPVVDRIKQSIQDSSASIPRASVQLTSVTQATEMATVEMLNELEAMTQTISSAESVLSELHNHNEKRLESEKLFLAKFEAVAANFPNHAEFHELFSLWGAWDHTAAELERISSVKECLKKAQQDSVNITMALQVQDITSQQIAGVLHLIESVRMQLVNILHQAETHHNQVGESASAAAVEAQQLKHSFDMNASYTKSADRQNSADEIIQQWAARQIPK